MGGSVVTALRGLAFLLCVLAAVPQSSAAPLITIPTTVSGYFNDTANAALVGSDLGTALFADDYERANNVAVYEFSLSTAQSVRFDSNGFAAGGADPYFTLFSGTTGSATFVGSNYAQAFSTGGDFDLTFALSAGDYTIAIGVFANMSLAENYGFGSLGDGFIFLGGPDFLASSYYEVGISAEGTPIPEPATLALLLPLMMFLGMSLQRRRASVRPAAG
jgi:hypothetical protein